jgi:hypothetical protein
MTSRLWAPLLLAAVSSGAPALAERKSGVAVRPPRLRSAARVSAAGAPASCAAGFPCHMLYYGGHVIPNAKVYVINWTAGVSAGGDLGAFYDAVTNSTYLDWLNEYDTETPDGSHVIEARAVDSSGESTLSAPVTVTVDNASAPPVQHGGGGCASSGAGLSSLLGLAALRRRKRPVA